jgi:hypothetical protein
MSCGKRRKRRRWRIEQNKENRLNTLHIIT